MELKGFLSLIGEAVEALNSYQSREALLVFHDDADGLSSGAIAYETLRKLGYNIKLVCIEKLMEQIIKYIHSNRQRIILYVDIASPHADKISRYNKGRNLTLILDHHDPTKSTDPLVYNINPEFYGMEGERDASGSVVTYFFSKAVDPSNIKLAPIALIGAQEIPGRPRGLNIIAYREAQKTHVDIDYKKAFSSLQVLGSVGYYQNGPLDGVKACLEGFSGGIIDRVNKLEEFRKSANRKMLAILYKRGLNKMGHIQWFDSYNIYRGMGTKVIGTFCSYLSYQTKLIDQQKYIVGFMDMPNEIPGLMELEGEWTKVSLRPPKILRKYIGEGRYPSTSEITVKTAELLGGFGDGHKYAASAVIPRNKKEDFVEIANGTIGDFLSKRKMKS